MMMKSKNKVGKKLTKKLFAGIVLLLLFFSLSYNCRASIVIYPEEISIKMEKEFIFGNTTKRIFITNNNKEDFNVTWYLENPTPPNKIRPNRTTIPDLSWIYVEPKWKLIPPGSTGIFYIHLNIPKNKETVNQKWESWITFKAVDKEFFNIEYAIRLYIDTPLDVSGIDEEGGNLYSIKKEDQFTVPLSSVLIVMAIIAVILIVSIKMKKKKN